MTLIDEYLRAVALLLPKDKREDIIEELRELILSRLEARESELGRPLTDDDTETVLRQIGHPLVVASRYRDGPQHVVGPALYPYWMFAVKAAVTIQVVIAAVVFLVRALTGDVARAFGQAIASGFTGAVMLVGIATIAAWLIERGVVRIDYFDRWRVRDLHVLSFAAWDADAWRDWFDAPPRRGAPAKASARRRARLAQRPPPAALATRPTRRFRRGPSHVAEPRRSIRLEPARPTSPVARLWLCGTAVGPFSDRQGPRRGGGGAWCSCCGGSAPCISASPADWTISAPWASSPAPWPASIGRA